MKENGSGDCCVGQKKRRIGVVECVVKIGLSEDDQDNSSSQSEMISFAMFAGNIKHIRRPRPKSKDHSSLLLPPHLNTPDQEYTQSKREDIRNHIERRDGLPSQVLFSIVSWVTQASK